MTTPTNSAPTREQVKELELKVARLEGIIETLMKQQQPLHVYGPVTQQRQFDWPILPLDPLNPYKVTCDTSKIIMNESDCDGGSRAVRENES